MRYVYKAKTGFQKSKSASVGTIIEVELKLKDNSTFSSEVSGKPIKIGNRKLVLGIVKDITIRKKMEKEKLQLEAPLRQQQQLESIGTLANNPINGIMNYACLISKRLDEENPLKEYPSEIIKESERIATIVKKILAFSKNEKETHSLARIEDIINDTVSLIKTIMLHEQITLSLDIPDNLVSITCSSQQIRQVLMNLMTNARDSLNKKIF